MGKERKHWILQRLAYLRNGVKNLGFTSGTERRRREFIEVLHAINNSSRTISWVHSFHLAASDDGATARIVLTPKKPFNQKDGKITLEFPSFHNTHHTVFIFAETEKAVDVAKAMRKHLLQQSHELMLALEFPIILKQGRKLIPLDPP